MLKLIFKKVVFIILPFCISISVNAKEVLFFSTGYGTSIQQISELVLREAYNNIGLQIQVERFPISRALIMANKGDLDGEVSRVEGIDKEFENLIRIPIAINFIEGYAFMNNSDIKISDWENMHPYRLVCVEGVKFISLTIKNSKNICHSVTTYSQAIKMLHLGRVDIAILPKINGMSIIKKLRITGIKLSDKPLVKLNLYHYLNKKNKGIVLAISDELMKMKVNGRIRDIRQQYIENNDLQ
jgi:polar amino acid transport system substrate-binding protein